METLTSETVYFIRLKSDIETRLFLLHFQPDVAVRFYEFNFELRATWQHLTESEGKRIERRISELKKEILQTKYN